jgi:hypothetical protein
MQRDAGRLEGDGWMGGWVAVVSSEEDRRYSPTWALRWAFGASWRLPHSSGAREDFCPAKIPPGAKFEDTEQETNLILKTFKLFRARTTTEGWDPREPRTKSKDLPSRKQLFECLVWVCAPVLLYEVVRFQVPRSKFNMGRQPLTVMYARKAAGVRIGLYRRVVRRRTHLWTEGQWPIQTYT